MHTLFHCGLSLMIGLASLSPAAAMSFATHPTFMVRPMVFPQSGSQLLWISQNGVKPASPYQPVSLPDPVQQAVLKDISQHTGENIGRFQIIQAQDQTWPDGCLGLGAPDVLCTMALVEGWQVQVSNGSQTWTYRTDAFGEIVQLEPTDSAPKSNPNSPCNHHDGP